MSIQGIPVRERVASVSVANGVPYECGPIRTLTCRHEPSSILEASEQAFGTRLTTMPHVQTATALGSLALSYWISTGIVFSHQRVHAVTCRVLNYSISSPPQLTPNAIIKYAVGLKSGSYGTL